MFCVYYSIHIHTLFSKHSYYTLITLSMRFSYVSRPGDSFLLFPALKKCKLNLMKARSDNSTRVIKDLNNNIDTQVNHKHLKQLNSINTQNFLSYHLIYYSEYCV